jgi:uncharacterized protein YcfJ
MTMNATTTLRRSVLVAALLATTVAQAGPRYSDNETRVRAKVVSSEPIYETIREPQTQCWSETVGHNPYRYQRDSSGGAVLGAIAGGLIGSTVGNGNGRIAAAAVGAATGAVIGDRHDRYDHAPAARVVERCRSTEDIRQVISGYQVRYRYEGREYMTELPYDPGRFVNLRVTVSVDDDR